MFRQKMDAMIGDRPTAPAQTVPMPLSRSDSDSDLGGGGAGAVVFKPNPLNGKKKARKGRDMEIPLVEVEKENDDATTGELLSPIPIVQSAKRVRGGRHKPVEKIDEQQLFSEVETPCSSSSGIRYSNPVDTNPQVVPLRSTPAEEILPSKQASTQSEEVRIQPSRIAILIIVIVHVSIYIYIVWVVRWCPHF